MIICYLGNIYITIQLYKVINLNLNLMLIIDFQEKCKLKIFCKS